MTNTVWRKSSYSGTQAGSECVEVGRLLDTVVFRDSKAPYGPKLHLTSDTFRALINHLKR